MNNNEVFSLKRLTDEARLHIIKSFEYPELITFSFISTKTKALVQSFEMKIAVLSVMVHDYSLSVNVVYNDKEGNSEFDMFHHDRYRDTRDPLISMTNNEVFSLKRLTDEARLHVIKSFAYPALIAFSLISTKTKALVQSFEMKIPVLSVMINESSLSVGVIYNDKVGYSEFKMFHQDRYREPEDPLISMDGALDFIQASSQLYPTNYRRTYTWRNLGFSSTGLFKHLASIFTFSRSSFNVHSSIGERFDTVVIRNLLPEWTLVEIREASQEYAQRIFELFSGCTKGFDLGDIIDLVQFPQKVAIRNFDMLTIAESYTFDDMLVSNALHILLLGIRISDVNRFLKSWMRGSNPRMKKARITVRGNIDSEKLLKGLKYQNIGEEIRRDRHNESDEEDDDEHVEDFEERVEDSDSDESDVDNQDDEDENDVENEEDNISNDDDAGQGDEDDDDDDDEQDEEENLWNAIFPDNDNAGDESEDDLVMRKEVTITTVKGMQARVVMEERFEANVTVYVGN